MWIVWRGREAEGGSANPARAATRIVGAHRPPKIFRYICPLLAFYQVDKPRDQTIGSELLVPAVLFPLSIAVAALAWAYEADPYEGP